MRNQSLKVINSFMTEAVILQKPVHMITASVMKELIIKIKTVSFALLFILIIIIAHKQLLTQIWGH